MQISSTAAFAAIFPVLYQQTLVGCMNPLCDNPYCKSSNARKPRNIFGADGQVNMQELINTAQKSRDMFSMLCKVPLKVLLSRVMSPNKKFDTKSQMFLPVDYSLGDPIFQSLRATGNYLGLPFVNDIVRKYYFIYYPCHSFETLNNFLCIGTTDILEQFYNYKYWMTALKAEGLEDVYMRELVKLFDTASSIPKFSNKELDEEKNSCTITAFTLFTSDCCNIKPVYDYNYQTNARKEPITDTTDVDIHDCIEKYIAESTDEFKVDFIHRVDNMFMVLTKTVGYSCDPIFNCCGNKNKALCIDDTYKFVRNEMFNTCKVSKDENYLAKNMFTEILNFLETRLTLTLLDIEMINTDKLPFTKDLIPIDIKFRIKNTLKVMDMMWFLNLKYNFVKEKVFQLDYLNDNTKYNLYPDLFLVLRMYQISQYSRSPHHYPGINVIRTRDEEKKYDMLINVPNFETDMFNLREPIKISISQQTFAPDSFSFICHPYLFTSEVKSRAMSLELREKHTVDIPIIPGFYFGPQVEATRIVGIEVSRDNIVQDTIAELSRKNVRDLAGSVLKVKFKGEEGIDEGGVSMEFFNIVMENLMTPTYGTFKYLKENDEEDVGGSDLSKDGTRGDMRFESPLWFNKLADLYNYLEHTIMIEGVTVPVAPYLIPGTVGQLKISPSTAESMYYTGMLFGLVINNNIVMDVNLPNLFYKKLAIINMGGTSIHAGFQKPKYYLKKDLYTLEDLSSINPDLASSLTEVIKMASDPSTSEEAIDSLELYHSADSMAFGSYVSIPLIDIKADRFNKPKKFSDIIPKVTRATAIDFVQEYLKHECRDGVRSLFEEFNKGFRSVLDCFCFRILSAKDIRNCLVGRKAAHESIEELKKYCSYEGFGSSEKWIVWFWEILLSWEDSDIRKFLKFVTGSSRISVNGVKGLNFKIIANGDNNEMLPTSHVCFNILMLPKYSSKEIMENRLKTAIHNSEGFGLR